MLLDGRSTWAIMLRWVGFALGIVAGVTPGLSISPAWAQVAPVELTKTDITKLKTLDSSQWTALSVRLGDSKATAIKTLQGTKDIKVQDDLAAGRIFVIAPPTGNTVVMSVKITQGLVTAINLVGGFGEWLQGDTRLLFRAFEDDSLRYKFLGREDQHEVVKGGTTEAPAVDMSYSYFKEGILLHYGIKRSADGKQIEGLREMVLVFPAKPR
jgi:hypothetical protein